MGPFFDCQGSLLSPYFIKILAPIRSLFSGLEIPKSFSHSVLDQTCTAFKLHFTISERSHSGMSLLAIFFRCLDVSDGAPCPVCLAKAEPECPTVSSDCWVMNRIPMEL